MTNDTFDAVTEKTAREPVDNHDAVVARLEAEYAELQASNVRSLRIGIAIFALFALYLLWAGSQFRKALEPEAVAWTISGFVLDAVPEASKSLHELLVDGAPELAGLIGESVVEMIPTYRAVLQDELAPIIDEISLILAQTAVQAMLELDASGMDQEYADQVARETATAAVVVRLDALMDQAMDERGKNDAPSPRESIVAVLEKLEVVSKGLKRLERGPADSSERELLVSWLNLIGRWQEDANLAAEESYRAGVRIE